MFCKREHLSRVDGARSIPAIKTDRKRPQAINGTKSTQSTGGAVDAEVVLSVGLILGDSKAVSWLSVEPIEVETGTIVAVGQRYSCVDSIAEPSAR